MEEKEIAKGQVPIEPRLTDRPQAVPTKAYAHPYKADNEWWLVELWKEKRDVFKALVEHVIAFLLLIGALILFHFILKFVDFPPERKEILETIDFWAIAIALVIFGLTFLYRLVDDTVQTSKKKAQAERLLRLQMEKVLSSEIGLGGEALETYVRQELFRMGKLVK